MSTDDYNVRLLLAGELPRIIARFQLREAAVALAQDLAALGLAAIAGSNSELRHTSSCGFMARGIQLVDNNVIFRNLSGETIRISETDGFLILEGLLPAGAQKKEGKTKKTLNLPVTLLLGGIPVWSKSQSVGGPAGENEHFLRFYRPASAEPVVEIRSSGFDYSFLGEKKGFSSTENFKTAIATLRNIFPRAIYDNRLTRSDRADSSSASPQETLEQNCRLMYLFYVASPSARPAV